MPTALPKRASRSLPLHPLHATPAPDPDAALRQTLDAQAQRRARWQARGLRVLVAVLVIGAVLALLELVGWNWLEPVAFVIALLLSFLGVNTEVFERFEQWRYEREREKLYRQNDLSLTPPPTAPRRDASRDHPAIIEAPAPPTPNARRS